MLNPLVIVLCIPLIFAPAVNADPPEKKSGVSEPVRQVGPLGKPEVLRIGNANPEDIARTLKDVFPDLFISVVRDSTVLVIRGTNEEVANARQLVKEMTGDGAFPESASIKLLQIANGRPQEIASQLMPVFVRTGVTLAADTAHSTLLVRGNEDTIKQVEDLVKQIDRPPQNFNMEFSFLMATPQPVSGATPVPADLAKTAEELKRFGNISLLGRLQSVVTEGDKFEIVGQSFGEFTASIRGRIRDVTQGGGARLELDADVMRHRTESGNPQKVIGSDRAYNLQTTIRIEPAVDLAVGIAPSGSARGESGILIVRMTK